MIIGQGSRGAGKRAISVKIPETFARRPSALAARLLRDEPLKGANMAAVGIATLTGLPATAAPNGRSDSGLPIGVQIIGGYLEDRTTMAFAGLIEHEFGGFVPPPGL